LTTPLDTKIQESPAKYLSSSKYNDRMSKVKRMISIDEITYYKRELCYAMLFIVSTLPCSLASRSIAEIPRCDDQDDQPVTTKEKRHRK
jgi:hypothetical protein